MKYAILLLIAAIAFTVKGQVQLGTDINGQSVGENFGQSVSLSGDGAHLAVVGAPNNTGDSSGHVRVFEYNGMDWAQKGSDIDEASSARSVAISDDGSVIVIGSPGDSGAGQVRVFEFIGGVWTQLGSNIPGDAQYDNLGGSVSVSAGGDTIAVGAPRNGKTGHGYVRIYRYWLDNWWQVGEDIERVGPTICNGADHFGSSVALSSDASRIAIGASRFDAPLWLCDAGLVCVYELIDGNWVQLGDDLFGDETGNFFGYSLTLSGDGTRFASALHGGNLSPPEGFTRVFEYDGASWSQIGPDILGEASFEYSGAGLSMSSSGDYLAIGAPQNNGNGFSGHVKIWQQDGGNWLQNFDIDGEGPEDASGAEISLSNDGRRVAIGAPGNDPSGHVRVYELRGVGIADTDANRKMLAHTITDDGHLIVHLPGTRGSVSMAITDVNGRLVTRKRLQSTERVETVLDMAPGVYFAEVTKRSEVLGSFKMVKR